MRPIGHIDIAIEMDSCSYFTMTVGLHSLSYAVEPWMNPGEANAAVIHVLPFITLHVIHSITVPALLLQYNIFNLGYSSSRSAFIHLSHYS